MKRQPPGITSDKRSAGGPLRTLPAVRLLRSTSCAGRGRGCPAGALTVAVGAAHRLPCAARLEGVPHNSLRSLRSLRSNRMRQVSPRSALRAPPSKLRCSAPHTALPPGTPCRSSTGGGGRREPPLPAAKGCVGGARRACEAEPGHKRSSGPFVPGEEPGLLARRGLQGPRSAGFMARARSALRGLTWRILFERSERSERSELCAGPWARAPQGSRRAATTVSVARRAPPAHPFAATTARARKRTPGKVPHWAAGRQRPLTSPTSVCQPPTSEA